MSRRAIESHAKGKKRDRLALYIQNSCIKFAGAESSGASSISTCSSALDKFLMPEAATDPEIRFRLKNIMSSY